jgi:protein required for attachment to host cells
MARHHTRQRSDAKRIAGGMTWINAGTGRRRLFVPAGAGLQPTGAEMRKTTSWILIADGARARFLENHGPGTGLAPAPVPPQETRLHADREIYADRPGRVQESVGGAHHAVSRRVDWHRFEKEQFAERLARLLDEAAGAKRFDRLVLVAPPRTLGDLRAALAPATRAKVDGELDKDLTPLADHELPAHLAGLVAL